jgi:peptidoglycan/LPS O-acetylase OafA/YrhL
MPVAAIGALLVGHLVADDLHRMEIVAHGSPFRFLTLGCGCLLAFAEPQLFASPRRLLATGLLSFGVGLAIHPTLLFALGPIWTGTEWVSRHYAPFVQLLHGGAWCTGIVLLALHAGTTRWSPLCLLSWRPLRAIGRISYALYLYHLPIYATVVWPAPTTRNGLIAAGLSFAAAIASYFVIERPCQRFGNRFRTATRTPA